MQAINFQPPVLHSASGEGGSTINPLMHRFCTVSAPFSGILKSPSLPMNDLRCLFPRMVQFDLELPKHVFTETPVSPSISRVFKGFQELSGINSSRHPAPEKSPFPTHHQPIKNQKSKIKNSAVADGKGKVKPPVKFGKAGLQLLAPTI